MNKLNVFFSIIFLLVIKNSFAQVTQQWVNYYNSPTNSFDVSRAIATDNSGNIYVTGVSPSSTTGEDYATVKYNSAGVQQWTARYSAANSNDVPSGIIVDGLGNVIVTGSTTSPGRITTIKYNSAGIQQWVAKKGDSSFASVASRYKSSIALDNSENIYICGGTETYSTDNGSYLLIKYNANGDSLWSRTYDGTQFLIGLGSAASVVKVRGNNVYITGKSFDMNPNLTFATTIKYDLNGIMEWIRKDTLAGGIDNVTDMDIDAFGNVILVSNFGLNIVTIKYNSAGIRLWKIYYNGIAGNFYDEVTGVGTDNSGNVYITGNSHRVTGDRDYLTLKYDVNGNQLWEKFFNGTGNNGDYSRDIYVDGAGNSYITGRSYETGFHTNIVTIKYNTAGVQQWKIHFDGGNANREDEANALILDSSGNVIVTGLSSQPAHNEDFATIKYSQTVGVNLLSSEIPDAFSLSQNYPNPFNPTTHLEFRISPASLQGGKSGFVFLKVYDVLGNEVKTLVNENKPAGSYSVEFNGNNLPSGIYFYKLEINSFTATKKMLLIK